MNNELLNMFFTGVARKKLFQHYDFSVLYNCNVLVLMIYSCKDVLKDLASDLVGTFRFEGLLYFVFNFG